MKSLTIIVCCFLFYCIASGQSVHDLELKLENVTDPSQRISIQLKLAERLIARDPVKSEYFIKKALVQGQKLNDTKLLAEISYLYGKICLRRSDDANAEINFNSSVRHARQAGETELALEAVFQLADIARKQHDYHKAYIQGKEALDLIEALADQYDDRFDLNKENHTPDKAQASTDQSFTAMNKEFVKNMLSSGGKEQHLGQKELNRIPWESGILAGIALLFGASLIISTRFLEKKKFEKLIEEKNNLIEAEQKRSDDLLHHILPAGVAKEFKENGQTAARQYNHATVLLAEFKNFARVSSQLSPEKLVFELNYCFRAFDEILSNYPDLEKIKTTGDAYLCATGLTARETIPNNLIRAALEMQEFLNKYKKEKIIRDELYFEARIGIHTGQVIAGVVGLHKFSYDLWGESLKIAARLEAICEEGKINISEDTYRLIKYDFECVPNGKIITDKQDFLEAYYVKGRFIMN